MSTYSKTRSIEYNDNRISKYIAQYGQCYITGEWIGVDRVHCHHIKPLKNGGTDKYSNLVIMDYLVHKLIHLIDKKKIIAIIKALRLSVKQLEKLNRLRMESGNKPIVLSN